MVHRLRMAAPTPFSIPTRVYRLVKGLTRDVALRTAHRLDKLAGFGGHRGFTYDPKTGRAALTALLAVLLLWASSAGAGGTQGVPLADVTVTGTATTVEAARADRVALVCTNSNATVPVRWGSATTGANSPTTSRGVQHRATTTITITWKAAAVAISEGADVTMTCTSERE